jgi:RimJ/RimL family protein N-acetyltransferase
MDVPGLVVLFDEPSIDEWTPLASPFTTERATSYVSAALRAMESGDGLQLAVVDVAHNTVVGEVLAFHDGPRVELAYAVGAEHRGRGYAVRALRVLIEGLSDAWQRAGATSVVARIRVDNEPSIAVAERMGLVLTGEPDVVRERKGRTVRLRTWRAPLT